MCLLRTMLDAARRLRTMYCRGFTIVLSRRAAVTILSLLMIPILLMCWTVAPLLSCRALLTELTLVGGGDLTLSALLDLLMVAFGAAGMDGAVRNQAAATGTQPVPYVGQLLNRYLETALDAVLPAVWSNRISDGLSILANGTLYLDSDATAAVADFQRWAWSVDGANLEGYAPVVDSDDVSINGVGVTLATCSNQILIDADSYYVSDYGYTPAESSAWASMTYGSLLPNTQYYFYAYHSGRYTRLYIAPVNDYSASAVFCNRSTGDWQYISSQSLTAGTWSYSISPSSYVDGGFGSMVVHDVPPSSFSAGDVVGGNAVAAEPNTFIGPMQQGQGTQLPLGDAVTVSSETAATMHLLNYLRAAAAAYAGTGTAQVPVTDVDTGEDELLPLTVPLDTPIGVTGVTDAAIDQSGAVAGTDAVAGDFLGTDEYTMDLTQFFPFCIPFDIVALYEKFEAEAAAPVVDWPIPIPGQEEPYLLHLDFSAFDSLAVWVRRLELIAFAVGLMVMTKRLIQGGD